MEFLSTLSLRRATTPARMSSRLLEISIHALLAESDLDNIEITEAKRISIHALLAESDRSQRFGFCRPRYFYPRSPCGERPDATGAETAHEDFYPRSPCGERLSTTIITICIAQFLSTLSLRRATSLLTLCPLRQCRFLSTLSLRRATAIGKLGKNDFCNFYPRSPCGERHTNLPSHCGNNNFYPRSPCGERRRGAVPVILII